MVVGSTNRCNALGQGLCWRSSSLSAASVSRWRWTTRRKTSPPSSTARHIYIGLLPIQQTVSDRYHRGKVPDEVA